MTNVIEVLIFSWRHKVLQVGMGKNWKPRWIETSSLDFLLWSTQTFHQEGGKHTANSTIQLWKILKPCVLVNILAANSLSLMGYWSGRANSRHNTNFLSNLCSRSSNTALGSCLPLSTLLSCTHWKRITIGILLLRLDQLLDTMLCWVE